MVEQDFVEPRKEEEEEVPFHTEMADYRPAVIASLQGISPGYSGGVYVQLCIYIAGRR